jgi:hypothetical protein
MAQAIPRNNRGLPIIFHARPHPDQADSLADIILIYRLTADDRPVEAVMEIALNAPGLNIEEGFLHTVNGALGTALTQDDFDFTVERAVDDHGPLSDTPTAQAQGIRDSRES